MKKSLLIGAIIFSSCFTIKAQTNCGSAIAVANGSITTVPVINGTYVPACFGGTMSQTGPPVALKAIWYKYTATANGLLTISSVLPTNPTGSAAAGGKDTRVSIFSGTCSALTCYNGNDDVNIDTYDYRSQVTFPISNGTTYYVAWDNNWSSAGFDFSTTFTASDCLSPNLLSVNDFTNLTVDSATLNWDAAIGNPPSYDVDYGVIGHMAGAGMVVNTTTNSVYLTNLSTTNNVGFDVYIRSNCGVSQGSWIGPYRLLLVAELPYSNDFDVATDRADGFTSIGWGIITNAQAGSNVAQSGTGFAFSNTSTTAISDSWLFSRPINVAAGEEVTIKFFSKLIGTAGAVGSFTVNVGNANTDIAQETIIQSITMQASSAYVQTTLTWTAETAGTYFFSFHNNSPIAAVAGSIIVDTITFAGDAMNTDGYLLNAISIFPNPANDIINITNAENILVNGINIVDLNGRTVKSVKLDNVTEAQINISDLASGMYIMNITSDKGSMAKKIIKN